MSEQTEKTKQKRGKSTTNANSKIRVYRDNTPISKSYSDLILSKLKPNMVTTGYLNSVFIEDGNIDLNDSWIELSLVLLGMVYKKHSNNYLRVLIENKILSSGFNVMQTVSQKFTYDNNVKYYKIIGSSFYLETNMTGKAVIQALTGLFKLLGISVSDVKLNIVPLGNAKLSMDLTRGKIKKATFDYVLNDAIENTKTGDRIISISILDDENMVDSSSDAAIKIIELAYNMCGKALFSSLAKLNIGSTIGITKDSTVESIIARDVYESGYNFYSLGYLKETLVYIRRICNLIDFEPGFIGIKLSKMVFEDDKA